MTSKDLLSTIEPSTGEQDGPCVSEILVIEVKGTEYPDRVPTTFWIVPTTHEDLSWYTTAVRTALRVAEHKDGILKFLDEDAHARFTFEQAGAVEEYIQRFRPEKRKLVERLFGEGRLEIIGSQIQPEIFLGGGEAFFWNLQAGKETCARLGVTPSKALYIPDTFGFPSTMPKMLRAAGIDNLIFSRGLGDEARELGAVFNWVADDGSGILAVPIPDGYGNGNKLGRWTEEDGTWKDLRDRPDLWSRSAADRIKYLVSTYGGRHDTIGLSHMLICNGSDFEEIDTEIRGIAAGCELLLQPDMPGVSLRFGTLEQYLEAVKASQDLDSLRVFSGELRGALEQPILRGVESARMPLKQALEEGERAIYAADALTALALLKARQEPAITYRHDLSILMTSLDWARKTITPVYSHDAICGCGTDEVYYDMHQRIRDAREIAEQVARDSLANLAGTSEIYSYRRRIGEKLSIVNTLPYRVRRAVEIPLRGPLSLARGFRAEVDGQETPVQIVKRSGNKLAALMVDVEGFSARQVCLRTDNRLSRRVRNTRENKPSIENEFYRVDGMPDGTIKVTDRQTGNIAFGLVFEEQADRGDEYTFCPLEGSVPLFANNCRVKARVIDQGPVLSELQISITASFPRRLTVDRKRRSRETARTTIVTSVKLAQGIDRIDFRTSIDNRSEDHRIRVTFRTPGMSETVLASEPFGIEERSVSVPLKKVSWCEQPQATSHNQGLVAAGGLALFNRGLPEYEASVTPDGKSNTLALTLLRGVGWLSRSDLSTRIGEAGPFLETPDAQCLGTHLFEYGIHFIRQENRAELLRRASDYRTDLEIGPPGVDLENVIRIDGDNWDISTLKPAKDGTGAILRLYNGSKCQSPARVGGEVRSARRVLADDVTPLGDGDARSVSMRGGEILTLKLT